MCLASIRGFCAPRAWCAVQAPCHVSCINTADKVKLGVQKPSHFVPGTELAGTDCACVYTVVTVKTEHGKLTATVCTPRALLNSPVAHELSDGEVALLVLLNAGVPVHVQIGRAHV